MSAIFCSNIILVFAGKSTSQEREREGRGEDGRGMVGILQSQSKDCGVLPTSVDIAVHIGEDVLQSQAFQRLQSHDVCGMEETAPDDRECIYRRHSHSSFSQHTTG